VLIACVNQEVRLGERESGPWQRSRFREGIASQELHQEALRDKRVVLQYTAHPLSMKFRLKLEE
jgi:hypothetical protein